jgi:hypothetical protein
MGNTGLSAASMLMLIFSLANVLRDINIEVLGFTGGAEVTILEG